MRSIIPSRVDESRGLNLAGKLQTDLLETMEKKDSANCLGQDNDIHMLNIITPQTPHSIEIESQFHKFENQFNKTLHGFSQTFAHNPT